MGGRGPNLAPRCPSLSGEAALFEGAPPEGRHLGGRDAGCRPPAPGPPHLDRHSPRSFACWSPECPPVGGVSRSERSLSLCSRFLPYGSPRVALLHPCHLCTRATPLQWGLKRVQSQEKARRLGIWLAAKVSRLTGQEGRETEAVVPMLKTCPGGSSSPTTNTGRNALGCGALVESVEICYPKSSGLAVHNTQDPN